MWSDVDDSLRGFAWGMLDAGETQGVSGWNIRLRLFDGEHWIAELLIAPDAADQLGAVCNAFRATEQRLRRPSLVAD